MDQAHSKRMLIGVGLVGVLSLLIAGVIFFGRYLSTQLVQNTTTTTLSGQIKTDVFEPGEYQLILETKTRTGEPVTATSAPFTITAPGSNTPAPTTSVPPDPYGTATPAPTSSPPGPY